MRKVLFLNDCNGYEGHDPLAFLVEIPREINNNILYALESTQRGVGHRGGNWKEIMQDGQIKHKEISNGRKSDYSEKDYEEEYKLISGNY